MDEERKIGDSTYRRYTEYKRIAGTNRYPSVNVIWTFEVFREKKLVEKFREQFRCRCDSLSYVQKQMRKFGFMIEHEFSDYVETPFDEKQHNSGLILICKKAV